MAHRLVQACRFTGDSGTHTHSKAPKKLSCKEDNPAKAMEHRHDSLHLPPLVQGIRQWLRPRPEKTEETTEAFSR